MTYQPRQPEFPYFPPKSRRPYVHRAQVNDAISQALIYLADQWEKGRGITLTVPSSTAKDASGNPPGFVLTTCPKSTVASHARIATHPKPQEIPHDT